MVPTLTPLKPVSLYRGEVIRGTDSCSDPARKD